MGAKGNSANGTGQSLDDPAEQLELSPVVS